MVKELREIIDQKRFDILFQPIVSLSNGEVIGYEALTRGPEGSPFYNPEVLFREAKKANVLWNLEMVTRTKSIETFNSFKSEKLLFLNVDPEIIRDPRFTEGITKEILKIAEMDFSRVIFEITEKTAIEDFCAFRSIIDHYKNQGYKIAIDDVGSGYSGLLVISQIRPYYIKIDKFLIRDIDKDNFKKAIVKALVEFANNTNIEVIAEGIETIDELYTVIEMGIPLGQGFLLAKPSKTLVSPTEEIKKLILERNLYVKNLKISTIFTIKIGEIARRDKPVSPFTLGFEVKKIFDEKPNIQGIAVVNGNKPVGLVMKNYFFSKVSDMYGREVYLRRPISLLMDSNPLIFDYHTPISEVINVVATREEDKLYDYIIVVKDSVYYGIVPIITLLEKSMEIQLNIAKYSNPLTGLPGNLIIEEKIKEVIQINEPFSLIYFDLNNFKAYNDAYGFEKGDKVLKYLANILQRHFYFHKDSFLGHVGGDDFVGILKTYEVERLCKNIIEEFDYNIVRFYKEEDVKRGYIYGKDRLGNESKIPLMRISIAVVNNSKRKFSNLSEVVEFAAKVKARCKEECKKHGKSYYVIASELISW